MKMKFEELPSFINDALCALIDRKYFEVTEIMEEAQLLINAAEKRAVELAGSIRTWAVSVLENGVTACIAHVDYIADDGKELQEIAELLEEVNIFKKRLENDSEYQAHLHKAAA